MKITKKIFKLFFLISGCFLFLVSLPFCKTIFAMSSSSYQINADSINFGGTDDGTSSSYQLHDTGGEVGTGDSSSSSYEMRAGYQAMTVDYHISITCPDSVTMGAITGTGQSALTTNEATCTVKTDSPAGYSLTYSSVTAYLEDENGDKIDAYTPVVSGTPEQWNIDATASEWGARLKRSGTTTYDVGKWGDASGTEDYSANNAYWHNVTESSSFTVVTRTTETSESGDTEIVQFGAEVGASKWQPTGTYDVDVTMTAVSL